MRQAWVQEKWRHGWQDTSALLPPWLACDSYRFLHGTETMPERAEDRWIVSSSTTVSWRAGAIEIMSPISGAGIRTEHLGIVHLIHAFARPRPVADVVRELREYPPEQVTACIDELIEARLLMLAADSDSVVPDQWEPAALAFHRLSRQPGPRPGHRHATPAIARPRAAETISLGPPPSARGGDLAEVLEARRSSRRWPRRMIGRGTFSGLFWMSARNRGYGHDELGQDYVSRPYPSGGAAYSLELYPVIAPGAVETVPGGIYRYLPDSHGLATISNDAAAAAPFLEAAGRSASSDPPPVVVVISSRFARQNEVYGDLAYSLVLKEVGGLMQTFYLVAEYLGLAACALGGGSSGELFSNLSGSSELAEPVVGEFMIGPR
jgi:SagB-type dehydrogenase family enzyme